MSVDFDLGKSYLLPSLAGKQREVANAQLEAMYAGSPPRHFSLIGMLFFELWNYDSINLPVHPRVLDAGCGTAYYSEIIERYVPGWVNYTGVDYNMGMLRLAQQYYPDLQLLHGDLRNLHMFDDCSFDIVLSGAAIIHIKEWQAAVSELARVADRHLILHRTCLKRREDGPGTVEDTLDAYGTRFYLIRFDEDELVGFVHGLGFKLGSKFPTGEGDYFTLLFKRVEDGDCK